MIQDWYIYVIIGIVFWGVWGFLNKLALRYVDYKTVFLFSGIGIAAATIAFMAVLGFAVQTHKIGAPVAILAGALSSAGAIFFYRALARGKASLVIPLTALYPVITIALSMLLLKERITAMQGIGIAFAIIAGILLAL